MEKIKDELEELVDFLVGETIKSAELLLWSDEELPGHNGEVFGLRLEFSYGNKVEFHAAGDFLNWVKIRKLD